MVRAGGSASRIIGDKGMTDPGGGEHASPVGRCQPTWQLPVGHEYGPGWSSIIQAFPRLRSHPTGIHRQDNRGMPVLALGRRDQVVLSDWDGVGAHHRWPLQCPELGDLGGGCGLPDGIVGLRGN